MSLHRLSAGAGYTYLTRDTACGDVARAAGTPLTAYYTESGYPPGRWLGAGLAGLQGGDGLAVGSVVTEQGMARLFGAGRDPVTGQPLGQAYPSYTPVQQRIAAATAALPADLSDTDRQALAEAIETRERARGSRVAVAGFDLTFTVPKSASVLWALADPTTQAKVADAHHAAVTDTLAVLQARALFTRTGHGGSEQLDTRGMLAATFDHWDTRTGDPNLHTHVVLANKVQGLDGRWRSVDSRALHHATVALSEVYDTLLADHLTARLPVTWAWRHRGPRRNRAHEIDGITDALLAGFSTRSLDIDAAMQTLTTRFTTDHGRPPARAEVTRLRQQATRATRPAKTLQPLPALMAHWRDTAARITGRNPAEITTDTLARRPEQRYRATDINDDTVARLADQTLVQVMTRRATWTRWNVLTEAARSTRGLRMTSTDDRLALLDRVTDTVLTRSVPLDPPTAVTADPAARRADGASVLTRAGEAVYSHHDILDAEQRLLTAHQRLDAPTVSAVTADRVARSAQHSPTGHTSHLADDQVNAVVQIVSSGRPLDVLVGPAGSGKTRTLTAVRTAWETHYGRGSVVGLAPSATAAHELGTALTIACENTAKWLHETTGPASTARTDLLTDQLRRRAAAVSTGDRDQVRRLDLTLDRLRRHAAPWTLQAGQLLIVDEASLAGTRTLDTLRAQTTAAGAKLLLVGDHHQLSAIDAGGAFRLLAEHGHPAQLQSLWRFQHRWEADATRLVRHGDPDVIGHYRAYERVHDGAVEVMLDAAYTAWQTDTEVGHTALLIAADARTVTALNTRAHSDRVAAGEVQSGGIALGHAGERGTVGVGDRILTRRNDRQLTTTDGHVRNGALWTVTAIHPDGALTAHSAGPTPPGQPAGACVVLPPGYVADHVDLGYATSTHRAQGITVDRAHTLATPGMSREALYVGLTRGRDSNHLYVVTDVFDHDVDHPPEAAEPTATEVLTSILAASRAERSATQVRHSLRQAAETPHLGPRPTAESPTGPMPPDTSRCPDTAARGRPSP